MYDCSHLVIVYCFPRGVPGGVVWREKREEPRRRTPTAPGKGDGVSGEGDG